ALLLAAVLIAAPGSPADMGTSRAVSFPVPDAIVHAASEATAPTSAVVELSLLHAFAGDGLPARSPSEAGMSAERLQVIDRIVSRGIVAGGYPGASVVVG